MSPTRARTIVTAAVVAAAALTSSGCAAVVFDRLAEPSPSDMDTSGLDRGRIPTAAAALDEADLPHPKPSADASINERTAWEALRAVSAFARTADPDSESDCTRDPEVDPGSVLDCTVVFRGTEYEYHFGIRPDGTELRPIFTAPVLREIVEADLRLEKQTRYVRCDMRAAVTIHIAADEFPDLPCTYLDQDTGRQERTDASVLSDGEILFQTND